MGKFKEMLMDVCELWEQGMTQGEIALALDLPEGQVREVISEQYGMDQEYDESMDGDFDSAMASAGYGTDEDYGDYGSDDY